MFLEKKIEVIKIAKKEYAVTIQHSSGESLA